MDEVTSNRIAAIEDEVKEDGSLDTTLYVDAIVVAIAAAMESDGEHDRLPGGMAPARSARLDAESKRLVARGGWSGRPVCGRPPALRGD